MSPSWEILLKTLWLLLTCLHTGGKNPHPDGGKRKATAGSHLQHDHLLGPKLGHYLVTPTLIKYLLGLQANAPYLRLAFSYRLPCVIVCFSRSGRCWQRSLPLLHRWRWSGGPPCLWRWRRLCGCGPPASTCAWQQGTQSCPRPTAADWQSERHAAPKPPSCHSRWNGPRPQVKLYVGVGASSVFVPRRASFLRCRRMRATWMRGCTGREHTPTIRNGPSWVP